MTGKGELRRAVRDAVRRSPAADVYTRLTARSLRDSERHGIDLLLTSPALLLEAEGGGDIRLSSDDIAERADAVFSTLFVERSPVSAQAQAALWSLKKLGLDAGSRDLAAIRADYAGRPVGTRVADALDAAGLSFVAVQAGLFEAVEQPFAEIDERLHASLNLDVLGDPDTAWPVLAERGATTLAAARDAVIEAAQGLDAASLLVSAPFDGPLWTKCVVPASESLGIPVLAANGLPTALPDAPALHRRFLREGLMFHAYCSGATALEQLPGLWRQARGALESALAEAYAPLLKCGWRLSEGEIVHDIEQILTAR